MKIEWPHGPLRWEQDGALHISVPFTWNVRSLVEELKTPDLFGRTVVVGGPAVLLMPEAFDGIDGVVVGLCVPGVLQRVNRWATRTTTGCPNKCGFCAVPIIEGGLIELGDWPDLPIVCDNNLLAASSAHFGKVCDLLEKHPWSDFNQGLDARLLTDHHAERLARLPGCIVRLACDSVDVIDEWDQAFFRLTRAGFPKSRIRSYVLIGFGTGIEDAWERCEFVQERGVRALPQWYHPLDATEYGRVLPAQADHGWTKKDQARIMGYYYKHRGKKPQRGEAKT